MGTIPAEKRPLAVAAASTSLSREPARARVGLSAFDGAAACAFVSGGREELAEVVSDTRALAEALAGEDGDGARIRLLSRAAAVSRTQQRALEDLLGRCLAARDYEAVEAVTRVLDGVSKRLLMYAKHLAVESSLRRRPSVYIRNAFGVRFGEET